MARLADHTRVVAIGETGLDRHWKDTPFPQQEDYFARHLELAPKYQAENYIQHNINVPTGREGFVKFFSALPGQPMNPIPAKLEPAPALAFAKDKLALAAGTQSGQVTMLALEA